MDITITHLPEAETFETVIDGHRAFLTYEIYDGGLDIRKTLVPEPLGGQGIAGKLTRAAYDYARDNNLKCLATCSYAVTWLKRHPEYNGTASCDHVEGGCAVGRHQG
ncbi:MULTISPECIES: GNAT family N-acetyltransferase [unclassified Anaerobiospirillum]|uniref:GNAT family N-acetyltransferase n=1 Tax=unclassified Anaerobiospirillum TaxID=2647410 RepID=UPI001FF6E5D0|nr:N-acetyltransferase [Anaerobiospirillum sp. NML120449]MCK0535178.1 N-acetyltransferase [Anaerobiospirillum sp. NML120511]MCK0540299.1 N-acetyltransferase [Anaerobiospirillum sp. NML02-A-032]